MGTVPMKKVVNADAGDADHVGGNDWDDLVDYLNNVDKTGPVKVNTRTYFRSGKKELRNPADTASYKEVASAISADRNVTEPLLTGDDTRVYQAHTQTLSNKTLDGTCTVAAAANAKPFHTLLVKSGSIYSAIKHDGTVLSSSTTAETVIAAALTEKGTICFADQGVDWSLSGSFTGFTLTTQTKIISQGLLTGTRIVVPNGFSGVCFKINGQCGDGVGIRGLSLEEAGTPAKLWTGIKFEMAGTDNISQCVFSDIVVYHANIGIEFETTSAGAFIESSHFKDIELFSCNISMLFDQQSGNIHRNTFTNVTAQMNSLAGCTNGFKDVDGTENTFVSCMCWDPTTANSEMNIKSTAVKTLIIGGRLTGDTGTFVNQSSSTLIIDKNRKHSAGTNVIQSPDLTKGGQWGAAGQTTADGFLNGNLANIAVGTATDARQADSGGFYWLYSTGATVNSIAGNRMNQTYFRRVLNPYFKTNFFVNSNANVRVFAGLVSDSAAPTSAADPLNGKSGIALWFDSAVNANWRILHNDGTGASVSDDTGVAVAASTFYPVEIYGHGDTKFRFIFNGVSTDVSTEIPASTTALAYWLYIENTTGTSKSLSAYYVILRTEK